jgi:hypothetical protein
MVISVVNRFSLLHALVGICVCFFIPLRSVGQTTISFVSDTTWKVVKISLTTGLPVSIGNAQNVCLNAFAPPNCPTGATLYGNPLDGWSANLSAIPGATWIWAPGISGATTPADLNVFWFLKTIFLASSPISANISLAVDDYAEILVNGNLVGARGSVTSYPVASTAQSSLHKFGITRYLRKGNNLILIRAQNGPASFGGCSPSCNYSQNTAGVVFGGSITY